MRNTTRAEQAVKTQNLIYETALDLFQTNSYDEITVSRICKEARVSVGAFYHYFPSKEAVLMKKYVEFDSRLDTLDLSRGAVEGILSIINLQNEGAIEIGSKVMAKVMEVHLTTKGKYVAPGRRINSYLYRLATEGIEETTFDSSYSPDIISDTILRTYRGTLFDWALREGNYDLCKVSRRDILVTLDGFRVPVAE